LALFDIILTLEILRKERSNMVYIFTITNNYRTLCNAGGAGLPCCIAPVSS
jgi:hypothetical protein